MVSLLPVLSIFLFAGQALAHHGFVSDQEYHYTWRGRIVGGITEIEPRLAGLGFEAHVMAILQEPNTVSCLITEFKHADINQVLTTTEDYHNITYTDIPEEKLKLIHNPFKVTFDDHGRVVEAVATETDPEWLLNLKKAFVSAFNMNMYGSSEEENTPLHYNVMEESVFGVCETMYSISPIAEYMIHEIDYVPMLSHLEHPEEHLIITKTVNYSHCEDDNVWRHVSPGVEKCHHGQGDCTNKEARATSAMYIVEGSRHEFVIKHVHIHGNYYFSPIGHSRNQEFDVFAVSEITLTSVAPLGHLIKIKEPKVVTSLNSNYNLHMHSCSLVKSPIRGLTQFMEVTDFNEAYYNKIITMLQSISEDDEKLASEVQSLVFFAQQLHLNEMKEIWEKVTGHELTTTKYRSAQHTNPWTRLGMHLTENNEPVVHTPDEQSMIDVAVDILAMAGTNPSTVFLGNIIANGELTAEKAAQVLMTLPLTLNTPTTEILEELLELLKTEFVHNNEKTLGAGMLALSNIIYNYCVNEHQSKTSYADTDGVHHCHAHHPFIFHEVIPFFTKQATTYTLETQKLLALGNLGIVEVLPLLEPYVRGEVTHDVNLRQTAIYALSRMSESHPHMVQEKVMPVFQNAMDNYEVRQAALMVVLSTNPSPAIFKVIASSTWFEHSHQIQSYVYSIFDALVHNEFDTPYFTELKFKAEMALHLTKPVHYGNEYTHFNMISNMIKDLHEGVLLDIDVLGNQNAMIPASVYAKLRELFGGKEYTNFELKLFTEGLIKKLQNDFGYHYHSHHGKELTAVWFRIFGNMERFLTMEQVQEGLGMEPMNTFLQRIGDGIKVNFHKVLSGASAMMILPTEVGLPLYINSHSPKYLDIHGEVKGDMSNWENFHVSTDVVAHVEHAFLFNAFVINPLDEVMVGAGLRIDTKLHVPLKLQLDVDLHKTNTHDHHYKLTWKVPQQKKLYLKHDVVPYTFKKKFDYMPFYLEDNEEFLIERQQTKYTEEQHFGNHLFGLDLTAKVVTDRPGHSLGSFEESLKDQNLLSMLTHFYVPTSWHKNHYCITLDHTKSSTSVVEADLKYTKPYGFQAAVSLTGEETHSFDAALHYESDEFHVQTKNLTFKLHQRHPDEEPHDFQLEETLVFPDVDMTKLESVYNQDLTSKCHGKITFGPSSKTKQLLDWTATMKQTDSMKEYALNTVDKKLCDKHHKEHHFYSHHCLNALHQATTLNKKTIKINYEDAKLPTYVFNYAYQVLDYFKAHFLNYGTTDHSVTHNPGHLTVSFEHCPENNVWDIEVIRPYESISFQNIPKLPSLMECMSKTVIEHPVIHMTHQENHEVNWNPYCIYQGASITTFDNYTYNTLDSNSNCWYTVAKHCHDSADKTEVMLKPSEQGPIVKVLLDETNEVTLQKVNGEFVAQVNGETKDLPNNDKTTVEVTTTDSKTVVIHGGKIHSSLAVIDFETLRFKILHDGQAAALEVHQLHRNKLCGLCGDFNGEPDDDTQTSHHCIHKSPKEFVASWIHKTDTCHPPPPPQKDCSEPRHLSTAEASFHVKELYHEDKECKHLSQIVEYFPNQICISTKKIPVCNKECRALYPTVINTSFYCDTTSEAMEALAKQVHSGQFVDVHEHTMTHMDVTYPLTCVH